MTDGYNITHAAAMLVMLDSDPHLNVETRGAASVFGALIGVNDAKDAIAHAHNMMRLTDVTAYVPEF